MIPRATLTLTDANTPEATVSGGNLADDTPVRGVGRLAFHATDVGSGLYRSILRIDGDEIRRTAVDPAFTQCADPEPSNDDAYEFPSPQPCPLDAAGAVQLDTAALEDGPHTIEVDVEDAAGNVGVVASRAVTTHNAPISTSAPQLSGPAKVGAQLTAGPGQWDGAPTGYGYRWLRCDADGINCAGIAGASDAAYVPTTADAYHRLVAEITAANHSGAATSRSQPSALVADAQGRTTPPATGGGSGAPGPGTGQNPAPAPGGVGGLKNPLGNQPGHVPNGAHPIGRPRIELGFRLADGRTTRHVRAARAHRWVLAGRLVDGDGKGIDGARLEVAWRIAGRRWIAHGELRTGSDGRFAYALPPGPSRSVELTYFPYSDSRSPITSDVVAQDAFAPLAIRADRRRLTGTRTVALSGRVGGELLPRGGVLVTLQGWQAGFGWRTFRTVRTSASGRWQTRYRFRLAHGRFGFRALVPRQGTFPFATSRSDAVYVTVA